MAKIQKQSGRSMIIVEQGAKDHTTRVAHIIRDQPEALLKLFSIPEDTRQRDDKRLAGPGKPPYADGKHKHIIYLTGANETLIKELVRRAEERTPEGEKNKQSKSVLVNSIIEFWLASNPEID